MDTSYIIIRSDGKSNVTNTTTNFTNILPTPLELNCEYMIGFQSISLDCNDNWGNTPSNVLQSGDHVKIYNNDTLAHIINITSWNYKKNELLSLLNEFEDELYFEFEDKRLKMTVKTSSIKNTVVMLHSHLIAWFGLVDRLAQFKPGVYRGKHDVTLLPICPKLIRIQVNEILGHPSNYINKEIIVLTDKKIKTGLYYSVKKKEYFNLASPFLGKLSISLLNENFEPLQLNPNAQATVIFFKLMKMTGFNQILRLGWKDSMHIFPSNTYSDFKVQLNKPLPRNVQFEIALSSMFLPAQIDLKEILKNKTFEVRISTDNKTFNLVDLDSEIDVVLTTTTFFAWFIKAINILQTQELISDKGYAIRPFKLALSNYAKYILGIEENIVNIVPKNENVFPKMKIVNALPQVIFVYCNIIRPMISGNNYERILKIIPMPAKFDSSPIKYEASHYEYHKVLLADNDVIHFQLRDMDNQFIKFYQSDSVYSDVNINVIIRQ